MNRTNPTATLPGGQPDPDQAAAEFARMVRAERRGDFEEARRALRALRSCGYSVCPLERPGRGGRAT